MKGVQGQRESDPEADQAPTGMRFPCLLVRTGEQVPAGSALAGGMGSPQKNKRNACRHQQGRKEEEESVRQRIGEVGEASSICTGNLVPLALEEGRGAGNLALGWRRSYSTPGAEGRSPRLVEPFTFTTPCPLPFCHSRPFLESRFWPLPLPGIGFRNDPGWDREAVPWNPILIASSRNHSVKRQAVPKRWALNFVGEALM